MRQSCERYKVLGIETFTDNHLVSGDILPMEIHERPPQPGCVGLKLKGRFTKSQKRLFSPFSLRYQAVQIVINCLGSKIPICDIPIQCR